MLDDHANGSDVLAASMRLFTADFVRRWYGKMLNIPPRCCRHSPVSIHGQALRAGVKISGATVHFVIAETDAGPILMQGAVAVSDHDTAQTLAERVLEVEHRTDPDALRLIASGQVRLDGFSVDQSRTNIDVPLALQSATLDLTQFGFECVRRQGPMDLGGGAGARFRQYQFEA